MTSSTHSRSITSGALVVTDNSRILGIITEHDIARGLAATLSIGRELMTKDVVSVDIDESLTTILGLMDQHQIHYIPV
jgi:CBS domain-containing protein